MLLWEFQVIENPFYEPSDHTSEKIAIVCYIGSYQNNNDPFHSKWTAPAAIYKCYDNSVFGPLSPASRSPTVTNVAERDFEIFVVQRCTSLWIHRSASQKFFVSLSTRSFGGTNGAECLFATTTLDTNREAIVRKVLCRLPNAIRKVLQPWNDSRANVTNGHDVSPVVGFLMGCEEYRALASCEPGCPIGKICKFIPSALFDVFNAESFRTSSHFWCDVEKEQESTRNKSHAKLIHFWTNSNPKPNSTSTLLAERTRASTLKTFLDLHLDNSAAQSPLSAIQKQAVFFYLTRGGRAINASEMGTGKTATAIACADFTLWHSPFLVPYPSTPLSSQEIRSKAIETMFLCSKTETKHHEKKLIFPRGSFWKRRFPCQFVLVVCPASVKMSWAKEFQRFAPRVRCRVLKNTDDAVSRDTKMHILQSSLCSKHREVFESALANTISNDRPPRKRRKQAKTKDARCTETVECKETFAYSPCAVVTSFASVTTKQVQELASHAVMIIIDESHSIKNSSSKRTKSIQKLAAKCPHVYLLSGTPGSKSLDLKEQLRAVSHAPSVFSQVLPFHVRQSYREFFFGSRYCLPKLVNKPGFGSFSRTVTLTNIGLTESCRIEELHVLFTLFSSRTRKEEALPDLPAKHRLRTVVHTLDETNKMYFDKKLDSIAEVRDLRGDKRAGCMLMELVRKTAELKIPFIRAHMRSLCLGTSAPSTSKPKQKILYFAHHLVVLHAMEEELKQIGSTFMTITGKTPARERQKLVDDFQNDTVQHAVLSIHAAGTGLNLFKATRVVVCELIWSDQHLMQAEDRAHRKGVQTEITVEYLVVKHSTDDLVWRSLTKKSTNSNWILDNERQSSLSAILQHRQIS